MYATTLSPEELYAPGATTRRYIARKPTARDRISGRSTPQRSTSTRAQGGRIGAETSLEHNAALATNHHQAPGAFKGLLQGDLSLGALELLSLRRHTGKRVVNAKAR